MEDQNLSLIQEANPTLRHPEAGRPDSAYQEHFHEIAAGTFADVIASLTVATDPRLRYPFSIRGFRERGEGSDIPVNPACYAQARFQVATEPESEEGAVYTRVEFGYRLYGDFRRVGILNYVRMNEDDMVVEVGCGSEDLKTAFLYHLFGRTLSSKERERIRRVQEEVFAYIRCNPTAQEKLHEFSRSRGWPAGLEDGAGLAYFDNQITPIEEFAEHMHISRDELFLTGWLDLSFTQAGQPAYSVRDFHVIRIPYFKDGRIEVWRTRNLRPAKVSSHKYTSWPLDRSIERTFCVEEKLYYGWELDKAKGRTLVLTEGEFKCLVATQFSGILTVGIPGLLKLTTSLSRRSSRLVHPNISLFWTATLVERGL